MSTPEQSASVLASRPVSVPIGALVGCGSAAYTQAMETAKAIRRFLASIGQKGGRTTAKRLTAKQRAASAKRAARARWAKQKNKGR